MQVDSGDSRYFYFFLEHGTEAVVYTELFPRSVQEIFVRTFDNRQLMHAVLAVSSMAIDSALQKPLTRALTHKQNAITSLQQSLCTGHITEDVAISIFLLLYMDCFAGKEVAQAHLNGLSIVLNHLKVDLGNPTVWVDKLSPLLMLIWRITIALDIVTAAVQRTIPVLPSFPPASANLHREWAMSLTTDVRHVDLGIISFAIDDASHRIGAWFREASTIVSSAEYQNNPDYRQKYDTLMRRRVVVLQEELAKWSQLPGCADAIRREQEAQLRVDEFVGKVPTFLDYPPMVIFDLKFVIMLNNWRALAIIVSLFPLSEAPRRTLRDVTNAIDICRTHVALQLPPNSKYFVSSFFAILAAGKCFAGGRNYTNEFLWCRDTIAWIDAMRHGIVSEFQDFVDSVKDFGIFKTPDWDIEDDFVIEEEGWREVEVILAGV